LGQSLSQTGLGGGGNVNTIAAFPDPSQMRDRILNEIKRLAAKNGGKAPGKTYFQQATGIAESDWYGKLWLRWFGSQREARTLV
jgi:hypothetical protein